MCIHMRKIYCIKNLPFKERKPLPRIANSPEHPRNPPLDIKLDAIKRCFEHGESIKYVSKDIGYSRASIYQWRKQYLKKGTLKREGITISEKIIRRIMKEKNIFVKVKKTAKYNSYAGEVGISPDAALVNTMLDDAINQFFSKEKPIIHSDRGWV